MNHSAAPGNGRGHPGERTFPGPVSAAHSGQADRRPGGGRRGGRPQLHLRAEGPPPAPRGPPKPDPPRRGCALSRACLPCHWCSRFRGRRRPPLPRGAAAPLPPRGRGSLPGASAPTSPAAARPRRRPAPRNPPCARGPPAGPLHPAAAAAAAHSTSRRAATTDTPPPCRRGRRGGSPPKRHQRASLEAASGEPGAGGGERGRGRAPGAEDRLRGLRGGLRAPGRSGEGGDAAGRGHRLPGARLHAEAQVGREGGDGRGGGSVTRFRAPPARRPGAATPRPASGRAGPGAPTPFPQPPPTAARSRAAGPAPPRPAPPRCTAAPAAPPPRPRSDVTGLPTAPPHLCEPAGGEVELRCDLSGLETGREVAEGRAPSSEVRGKN